MLLSCVDLVNFRFLYVSSVLWLQVQPVATDQTEIRSEQLYVL